MSTPTVRISSLIDGARSARGAVVVVDVFRAFTTTAVALARGAKEILLVAEPEEALALRERGAGELCIGEIGGKKPEGFDLGNSPFEVGHADIEGRTLILSTRAGTVGAVAASRAETLFGGAFVVAGATAKRLRREREVTIVAMGLAGASRTLEDELCALYIRDRIAGRGLDVDAVRRVITSGPEAARFGDPARPEFHPGDLTAALDVDAFDFAISIERREDRLVARRSAPVAPHGRSAR